MGIPFRPSSKFHVKLWSAAVEKQDLPFALGLSNQICSNSSEGRTKNGRGFGKKYQQLIAYMHDSHVDVRVR
jgi:hypothetical protein